jgi:hypothetical protein
MIVYGMNRLPLAQESTQELAPAAEPQAASGTASTAVPAHVLAEGSAGELAAGAELRGAMRPSDEDDNRPIIIKQ